MNTDLNNYKDFSDILNKKITISQWGKNKHTTKQNAHIQFTKFLNEVSSKNDYAKTSENILENKNKIIDINNKFKNKVHLEVFCYINKKNIIEFEDSIFYSPIEKKTLNIIIKETLLDMNTIDIEKAFLANNLECTLNFLHLYEKYSLIGELKMKPLDFIEKELKNYKKPMSKELLLDIATNHGIKEKTVKNIILNAHNSNDKILNFGEMVCDKDIFFNEYLDIEFANKFVLAAIAVCEKNDICSTDMKWIKNAITNNFSDLDMEKYNLYELKAILCNEPQFKKEVKLNLSYTDKNCQFSPTNITEFVEKILSEYTLPISFGHLLERINEYGKSFSKTTMASTILPGNERFVKMGSGWILEDNKEEAQILIDKISVLGAEEFFEHLKEQFKVVTLKDLSNKIQLPLGSIMDCKYKSTSLESFITKLNDNGWDISIIKEKVKIVKR